nr:uncharacterized protein LOC111502277 [Leptinotarsa decemlineata]
MLSEVSYLAAVDMMVDLENWLKADREAALKVALDSLGRTKKELVEYVGILKDWLKSQPHLPELPGEHQLMNIVLLNKFSIEICKERIDMHYTMRTLVPEIYGIMDSKNTLKYADILYFLPLPKRTIEEERITFVKVIDTSNNDFYSWMGYCFNVLEVRINEDICTTDIIISDMQKMSFTQFAKITPIHVKKFVTILEKVYSSRIKQFHFVNCPPFAYRILNLLKSLVKIKLASRLFFHEDCSIIKEIIPVQSLPKDFGGLELSLFELNELWKKKLIEFGNRFDSLSQMKTNEKLRPSPLVNDEILGFHGNFKKLEMD